MLRLRSVAGFAVHMRMLARLLHIENIGVAGFAGVMTGIVHGARPNLPDRSRTIVSIAAKGLWNDMTSYGPEHEKRNYKEPCKPKQVLDILKWVHPARSSRPGQANPRAFAIPCDPDHQRGGA